MGHKRKQAGQYIGIKRISSSLGEPREGRSPFTRMWLYCASTVTLSPLSSPPVVSQYWNGITCASCWPSTVPDLGKAQLAVTCGYQSSLGGSLWAMPLWQSMQVSPAFIASCIFSEARADCLWKAMLSKLWQLRHSLESLSFMTFQT